MFVSMKLRPIRMIDFWVGEALRENHIAKAELVERIRGHLGL